MKHLFISFIFFILSFFSFSQNNDTIINSISNYIDKINSIDSVISWYNLSYLDSISVFYEDGSIGCRTKKIFGIRIPLSITCWKNGGFSGSWYSYKNVPKSIFFGEEGGKIYNRFLMNSEFWRIKEYYKNGEIVAYHEIREKGNDSWFNKDAENYKVKYELIMYFYERKIIYSKINGKKRKLKKYQNDILQKYFRDE